MAMWETREIWAGKTPGGHDVSLWVKEGTGIWMDNVWRIEWTVNGAVPRNGESFEGLDAMQAGLEAIKAKAGQNWQQLD